jgi:hypothetical protein
MTYNVTTIRNDGSKIVMAIPMNSVGDAIDFACDLFGYCNSRKRMAVRPVAIVITSADPSDDYRLVIENE